MKLRKTGTALAATAAIALAAPAAPAMADEHGTTSLAEVLGADSGFDNKWNDFDIVEAAVYAVLGAKPDSPVAVLADGTVPLTAFVPTDRAFRKLANDLFGKKPKSEQKTFEKLAAAVDIDTLEAVLLYHVVPGATVTYKQALAADGAELTTAAELPITVKVQGKRVVLRDLDTDDKNPRVRMQARNINKGNVQIAHGIDRVLRPIDLP